jgi:hypothetical protein
MAEGALVETIADRDISDRRLLALSHPFPDHRTWLHGMHDQSHCAKLEGWLQKETPRKKNCSSDVKRFTGAHLGTDDNM